MTVCARMRYAGPSQDPDVATLIRATIFEYYFEPSASAA